VPKKKPNNKKDKKLMAKMAKPVKLSQTNYLGRSIHAFLPPSIRSLGVFEDVSNSMINNDDQLGYELGSRDQRSLLPQPRQGRGSYLDVMQKDNRRKGTAKHFDHVPECYGWRYLSAILAINQDDSADIDVLSQSVSDMLDIKFAETVAEIIQTCGERITRPTGLCPPVDPRSDKKTCVSQCHVHTDCGYKELCCRQLCSNQCVSVLGKRYNKCGMADQYMQCVYNMIDSQLCDSR